VTILIKTFYRFDAIPIRIPLVHIFFNRSRKTHPKIYIRSLNQLEIAILKMKQKTERPTLPNFKTYYKATVIKTVWYWYKNFYKYIMYRLTKLNKEPGNKSSHMWPIDFQPGCQGQFLIKRQFFNTWCWYTHRMKLDSTYKRMKLESLYNIQIHTNGLKI
jgi:hypothetical protein